MTQKELLLNYLSLETYKNTVPPSDITDVQVGDLTIVRKTPTGYYVYYLFNGNSITIPWEWINIFSSFDTHSGSQSKYIGVSKGDSKVDKFIYHFLMLIFYLNIKNGEKFVQTLASIFEIGSKEFRSWLDENNINIKLGKIIFSSIDNEIVL